MAKKPSTKNIARYNLALPTTLYDEVKQAADNHGVTVVDIIRKFLQIGLMVLRLQDEPGAALIIREGDSERQILIF